MVTAKQRIPEGYWRMNKDIGKHWMLSASGKTLPMCAEMLSERFPPSLSNHTPHTLTNYHNYPDQLF